MEGMLSLEEAKKIRKRGCSPSSSTTSSVINHGYKFKRAIFVGKRQEGGRKQLGSSTPMPTWRMVGSRSPSLILRAAAASSSSPRYPPSLSGISKPGQPVPVSARKLAATLWEMNELPFPSPSPRRGKMVKALPPHLYDPSHNPASHMRMERSGSGSHRRRESSMSRRTVVENYDSCSNATFMETESRSQCQTSSVKTRLKDVSNALTTSKELLRIISRVWGHDDQPSPSMSLISALHSELERARLKINQLILDDNSDSKEINYLLKRFSEEKAVWKNNEQELVESAVETISGELEVERKLRKQFQSLNKKLGKELAETKVAFHESMKKIERGTDDDDGNSSENELHSIDLSKQNGEIGRRSCGNERPVPRYKLAKGYSRMEMEREFVSPLSQRGPPWPSRDHPCDGEVHRLMPGMEEGIAKGYTNKSRRSRR